MTYDEAKALVPQLVNGGGMRLPYWPADSGRCFVDAEGYFVHPSTGQRVREKYMPEGQALMDRQWYIVDTQGIALLDPGPVERMRLVA